MNFRKYLTIISFSILACNSISALNIKNGDLIFQESCSDDNVGDAIKNVTESSDNYQFTHVGIVYIPNDQDSIFVIEATSPKVRMVPLIDYLYPKKSKKCVSRSVIGRIDNQYQSLISDAIKNALTLIGKDYDYGFVLDNDKYYCSELIYEIFRMANYGNPVFELNTMTFKSKDSDETDKNWITYFESRNLTIPEAQMGINPGAISLSSKIEMLGQLKNSEQRSYSPSIIRGLLTDSLGRCIHYSSEQDIVANQCYKCKKYYSCYKCHNLCENHDFLPWPVDINGNSEAKVVLCGNCFYELSINEYKQQYACTKCKKQFNPKCALHSEIYFNKSSIR